jgi:hypothetical protein
LRGKVGELRMVRDKDEGRKRNGLYSLSKLLKNARKI